MAEALAVLAAMTFARDHGIDSISLFSVSQVLINTINRHKMKLAIMAFFVISILYLSHSRQFSLTLSLEQLMLETDSVTKEAL
ncbi:hypothetical protein Bca4012_025110 [Brassica carinata]|uniref:RNase H type-1 domain-containing protein n=1 Tax=Brassica carinata TaxID=52824 RepID=A0A8X7VG01_BRACI|nr:hypothetical protein Bca52824_022164 [Brassica carinata]